GFQIHWDPYGFAGVTRSYTSFWDAANEQARSRVYGGIHFSFDNVAGQQIGTNVANYVMENYLEPRRASALDVHEQTAPFAASPFRSGSNLDAAGSGEDLEMLLGGIEGTTTQA